MGRPVPGWGKKKGPPGGPRRTFRKSGGGRSPRALPRSLAFGAVSFRGNPAASFPTLIFIASEVIGLLAGPFAGLPAANYWVRLLRLDGWRSLTPPDLTMRKSAYKALRASTFYPGSAPAFGGTLASGYGSCLLPLRSHFLCSQAILFSVRLKQEVLSDFAGRTHSPSRCPRCAPPIANWSLLARLSRQGILQRAGSQ